MKVSIIVRTHNEEKTIKKVFEALKNQTYTDFETILVDNSSTDKTLEIARKYKIDKFISIPKGEFSHPKSLNDAIKIASGDLIVITNGHSVPMSNTWLEDGIKNFQDKKVAGITGYYSRGVKPKKYWIRFSGENLTNTNSIIRKDLWKEYNFDENMAGGEDYDWGEEMLARGYKIIKDPKFSVSHYHIITKDRKKEWAEFRDYVKAKNRPSPIFHKLNYQVLKITN
jgi:rhamnosyltransferase